MHTAIEHYNWVGKKVEIPSSIISSTVNKIKV